MSDLGLRIVTMHCLLLRFINVKKVVVATLFSMCFIKIGMSLLCLLWSVDYGFFILLLKSKANSLINSTVFIGKCDSLLTLCHAPKLLS
ncbi:uncharacterized protein RHIMIDRAFT_21684 [Rhizopus microsporus ATCC 52813]|uniref:Uncharacterized protein n=1 Tax=Rhizopus microsporus ATCC 52813 TaxID=1340429 RepID=A0A2G4SR37_RHIZD|nr:uncharacterized protein RHIMIDRAFT_21684 [Rhizopus microsporus ATCC 52813]PHZ11234.1 hypothetical protein RHIMIDRAFT_21684 [Rhizopus microsporus ATCC 52813]